MVHFPLPCLITGGTGIDARWRCWIIAMHGLFSDNTFKIQDSAQINAKYQNSTNTNIKHQQRSRNINKHQQRSRNINKGQQMPTNINKHQQTSINAKEHGNFIISYPTPFASLTLCFLHFSRHAGWWSRTSSGHIGRGGLLWWSGSGLEQRQWLVVVDVRSQKYLQVGNKYGGDGLTYFLDKTRSKRIWGKTPAVGLPATNYVSG